MQTQAKYDKAMSAAAQATEKPKEAVDSLGEQIKSTLKSAASKGGKSVKNGLVKAFSSMKQNASKSVKDVGHKVSGLGRSIKSAFKSAVYGWIVRSFSSIQRFGRRRVDIERAVCGILECFEGEFTGCVHADLAGNYASGQCTHVWTRPCRTKDCRVYVECIWENLCAIRRGCKTTEKHIKRGKKSSWCGCGIRSTE